MNDASQRLCLSQRRLLTVQCKRPAVNNVPSNGNLASALECEQLLAFGESRAVIRVARLPEATFDPRMLDSEEICRPADSQRRLL